MRLESGQSRIVKNKNLAYGLLRGAVGTGKTTAAIYRGIYLKNQYCMYEKDKVLILAKNEENLNYIKNIYNNAEKDGLQYITLFSYIEDKLYFSLIDKIIDKYFSQYIKNKNVQYKIANEEEKLSIIDKCIKNIKNEYRNLKYVDIKYSEFFLEEIQWIKDCMYYDLEEYKNADRVGRKTKKGEGPERLIKNSLSREAVFKVMLSYNKKLKEKALIDYSDVASIALKEVLKNKEDKFTHIVVDEAQSLTKLELKFIEALGSKNIYSSILFVVDKEEKPNSKGWITKGRKLNKLNLGFEFKRFNLNKKLSKVSDECDKLENYIDINKDKEFLYSIEKQNSSNIDKEKSTYIDKESSSYIDTGVYNVDKFQYIDIKHRRTYEFLRDLSSSSEIIIEDQGSNTEYKEDELTQLPVFNDIAAGEPILMNPYVEDNFYIPKYWVKGMKDCFILKVKGDSMIGANIEDGDHVVIRKQQMAENNDIVAVNLEGSATLKRLLIKKSGALLMPENEKYSPIEILEEDGASIIGVAVAIIKEKQ